MRQLLAALLFLLPVGWARVAEPSGVSGCLSRATPRERVTCIEVAVTGARFGPELLDALGRVLPEEPEAVARVARKALERGGLAAGDRAALHDLEGQALYKLGRMAEAAEAFEVALALEDGSTRVVWWRSGEEPSWTAALDAGSGRLERAARALLSAGRKDAARRVLQQAIRLGVRGWPREAGWEAAGGGEVSGLQDPRPILADPPFPKLPDLTLKLLDGGAYALSSARGKVLLLDFWASWCAPCLQELPQLQALYDAERRNGLEAIAVNAEEPQEVVRQAARRLGLSLPIAAYDETLDRAFKVRVLPAMVLVDREGRMRARWDGYQTGLESVVASKARRLLGDDPEGRPRKIAEILAGADRLQIAWVRDTGDAIGGLAVVTDAAGARRVAVSAGGSLLLLGMDGEPAGRIDAPVAAGRLVTLEASREGDPQLAGFRVGASEIALLDLREGKSRTWRAPSPVLDAAPLPPAEAEGPPRLALATTGGLYLLDLRALEARKVEGTGETASIATEGEGAAARPIALDARGRIRRVDAMGGLEEDREAPPGSARLLVPGLPGTGFGTGPSRIAASAGGRILGGPNHQVAAATTGGQLVLLDPADGRELFRAGWPGITSLVVADLDADGGDELLVASDRYVVALRARPALSAD